MLRSGLSRQGGHLCRGGRRYRLRGDRVGRDCVGNGRVRGGRMRDQVVDEQHQRPDQVLGHVVSEDMHVEPSL